MANVYLWGDNALKDKNNLRKKFKVKWSKKKKYFYLEDVDQKALSRIMKYCQTNKINYKTDTGQSYEVVTSELIEASARELRDWGADNSRGTPYLDEVDYEQMWEEKEESE